MMLFSWVFFHHCSTSLSSSPPSQMVHPLLQCSRAHLDQPCSSVDRETPQSYQLLSVGVADAVASDVHCKWGNMKTSSSQFEAPLLSSPPLHPPPFQNCRFTQCHESSEGLPNPNPRKPKEIYHKAHPCQQALSIYHNIVGKLLYGFWFDLVNFSILGCWSFRSPNLNSTNTEREPFHQM